MTPPNTRVQRTRSSPSALREPLTRHTLGHAGIAMAVIIAVGCSSGMNQPTSPPASSQVLAYQSADGAWHEQAGDVALPVITHHVNPLVPPYRRDAVSGVIGLKALVSSTGMVEDVVVLRSLSSAMDEEAIKAVRQWRYRPATLAGQPVAVWLTITVRYQFT